MGQTQSTTTPPTVTAPVVASFEDILKLKFEIIDYASKYPTLDVVYYLPMSSTYASTAAAAAAANTFIAGSSALHRFITTLRASPESVRPSNRWECNDYDVFTINAKSKALLTMGPVQLVDVMYKSVQEMLLDFDLPCCRVAINSHKDYYVSLQCLAAILSGVYALPSCFKSKEGLIAFINESEEAKKLTDKVRKERIDAISDFRYERLSERIDKYKGRGFNVIYHDIPLPASVSFNWLTY
jgi:hypothetical protein